MTKLTPYDTLLLKHIIETGGLREDEAEPEQRDAARRLAELGVVAFRDGAWLAPGAFRAPASSAPPKPQRQKPPPYETIQVRVPGPWRRKLEALGPTVSIAARDILGPALEGEAYEREGYTPVPRPARSTVRAANGERGYPTASPLPRRRRQ